MAVVECVHEGSRKKPDSGLNVCYWVDLNVVVDIAQNSHRMII